MLLPVLLLLFTMILFFFFFKSSVRTLIGDRYLGSVAARNLLFHFQIHEFGQSNKSTCFYFFPYEQIQLYTTLLTMLVFLSGRPKPDHKEAWRMIFCCRAKSWWNPAKTFQAIRGNLTIPVRQLHYRFQRLIALTSLASVISVNESTCSYETSLGKYPCNIRSWFFFLYIKLLSIVNKKPDKNMKSLIDQLQLSFPQPH